jgi:hypothetical protein
MVMMIVDEATQINIFNNLCVQIDLMSDLLIDTWNSGDTIHILDG